MQFPRSCQFALALVIAAGCAKVIPVHKENIVGVPVVMPTNMCAARGTVAMSLGREGERMICELQTPLGSHLARCTCWDEGMIAQQRQDTQNIHEQMEVGIQTCMSGSCNDGLAGRR
jgi:hypothetical protein